MGVLSPGYTPEELRPLARELALTYRRIGRRRRAEGATIQRAEHDAADAAIAKYQELDPSAPREKVEASHAALMLIANGIRVNTTWYWEGPDA